MKYFIILVVCFFAWSSAAETKPGRFLTLPVPQKCANRKSRYFIYLLVLFNDWFEEVLIKLLFGYWSGDF